MRHLWFIPIILFILTSCAQHHSTGHGGIPFFSKSESELPKHQNITFWDPYIQDYRGIRVMFYTVLTERENRLVDQRLHNTFANLLGHMCQKVITIDSFEESTQKRMVENVLVSLVDQWKQQGKVDPQTLFAPLPFLDADVIVFMERNAYEQTWVKEDKKLLIGLNVAAFELDLGEPLYSNRFVTEVPWSGEDTSYTKAERQALLRVANQVGETFAQSAQIINRAHQLESQQQQQEALAQQQDRKQQLQEQHKAYASLIAQAKDAIKTANPELPLVSTLQQDISNLEALMKTPVLDLNDEQIQAQQNLAYSINTYTQQLLELMTPTESESVVDATEPLEPEPAANTSRYPTGFTPIDPNTTDPNANSGLSPLPSLTTPSGNIFDRNWLVPENKDALNIPPAPADAERHINGATTPLGSSQSDRIDGQELTDDEEPVSNSTEIPSAGGFWN